MGVTPDGHFALMLNLTPATSVTAVDLESKKWPARFNSRMLGNPDARGSRVRLGMRRRLDAYHEVRRHRQATEQKRTAKPFFDVEKDPVFQLPAMIDKKAYFVSYHGIVYPMDLSSSPAEPETRGRC